MSEAPLRISVLAQMARSPLHAKYALDNESEPTATMRLGTLAHAFILGKNTPCIYTGDSRRGKAWLAFKADHPDEEIFLEKELEPARAIASAIMSNAEAPRLLMGRREETITWRFMGRLCRGTPDCFNPRERHGLDLKTTVDASKRAFGWQALRLGYYAKAAWYVDGLKAAGVAELERFFIIAAENKPPYAVAVYQLTPAALEFGRKLYRSWLEEFVNCERANAWRGYLPDQLDAPEEGLALTMDGELVEVD